MISSTVINLVASHLRTTSADEFNMFGGSAALTTVYIRNGFKKVKNPKYAEYPEVTSSVRSCLAGYFSV